MKHRRGDTEIFLAIRVCEHCAMSADLAIIRINANPNLTPPRIVIWHFGKKKIPVNIDSYNQRNNSAITWDFIESRSISKVKLHVVWCRRSDHESTSHCLRHNVDYRVLVTTFFKTRAHSHQTGSSLCTYLFNRQNNWALSCVTCPLCGKELMHLNALKNNVKQNAYLSSTLLPVWIQNK